jgi:DNA-binding MarR family transcriptional regulator
MLGDMFSTEAPFAMLLALYAGRTRDTPHTVTELNEATRLPPSTALRWLGPLVSGGWVARTRGSDARRAEFRLTKKASEALDDLFSALP